MRRILSAFLALLACTAPASVAVGGDTGKLRYIASIYLDATGTGMKNPEGVACNDRTLLVADTGTGRLLRYTMQDDATKPVGEIQVTQLSTPTTVQLTSKDEVFALDAKQRRILRFGADGAYRGPVTPEGVPAPTSVVPRSFRIDRTDTLYVLDVFSARVLVLGLDGTYKRHIPFPKRYGFFSDLAVDDKGGVFLIDSIRATVWSAPKDAKEFVALTGSLRQHVSFPTAISVDRRGVIYAVDQNGSGVLLIGQDGAVIARHLAMGWNEGQVYNPSQLCVTDNGHVVVADRGNNRVQVFSLAR